MNGKKARKLRKKTYDKEVASKERGYFRSYENGQIVSDELRGEYKKNKNTK